MALIAGSSAVPMRAAGTAAPCRFGRPEKSAAISKRRCCIVSATLGFTTDPRIQTERAADGLLKDVASLLVYQEVFRTPPAQAFLKFLLVLRRRDDDLKVLEAYGEFFRLMAAGKHSSWQDFLLEGILRADGNSFAEAAAGSGDPSSYYGGRIPASLEAAAVADLESLQRLSLNESTMINWVTELVSETKPQWRSAASASLGCGTVRKVEEKKPRIIGFMVTDDAGNSAVEDKALVPQSQTETILTESDFVTSERQQWQKKISGLWNWSEAVDSLKEYHLKNGFGRVAAAQVLKWRGGKLVPDFNYFKPSGYQLSLWSKQRSTLKENVQRYLSQGSPRHVFVHGPPGSGKSWLIRATLRDLAEEAEFRVLLLPSNDLKQLPVVLDEMRKNSGIRFVLVIDDLFLRSADESYVLIKGALHEQEWPLNVLLCATSFRSEATIGDTKVKLGNIFALQVSLATLSEHEYKQCLEEILEHRGELQSSDDTVTQAMDFGRKHGLCIRNAIQFFSI